MIRQSSKIRTFPRIVLGYCCLFLLLGGCVAATKKGAIVTQPLTTSEEGEKKAVRNPNFPKNVAILPFINITDNKEAGLAVRQTLFNHFASKNYFSLHIREVDRRLRLANIEPSHSMDAKQIQQTADSLGVDGLIYGEVTHYDKLFAGLYAQVSVGIKMRFVARNGQVIWQGEHITRKHEGGISTTPIGLIIQAVAAAMHIQDINLFRASDELGREVVAKIPEPDRLAVGVVQNIERVVHDGIGRHLHFGDTLAVAMEGTPGQRGYVRIQDLPVIALPETEPGLYSGEMVIPADVDLNGVVVTGILEDDQGRRGEKIATTGYVFIDNTPPNPVGGLRVEGRDSRVNLNWQTPDGSDVDSFELLTASSAQGPFKLLATIQKNRFEQADLQNFTSVYYQVVAVDRAGNRSQPITGEGRPFPDPRIATAQTVPQIVPAILNGLHVLTAEGGPYLVQDKVDLTKTGILFVEPGTEIQLTPSGVFHVRGEFKVFGESARPVKVGGQDGMPFETFVELQGEKPVLMQGIEVHQGGVPFVISRGAANIDQVQILDSHYHAFEIKGTGHPIILRSTVQGGHGGVAIITDHARPRFENNSFINNGPVHIQCTAPYLIKAPGNRWQQPDISSEAALLTSNGCTIELD